VAVDVARTTRACTRNYWNRGGFVNRKRPTSVETWRSENLNLKNRTNELKSSINKTILNYYYGI
jgi:hypothetical protein